MSESAPPLGDGTRRELGSAVNGAGFELDAREERGQRRGEIGGRCTSGSCGLVIVDASKVTFEPPQRLPTQTRQLEQQVVVLRTAVDVLGDLPAFG